MSAVVRKVTVNSHSSTAFDHRLNTRCEARVALPGRDEWLEDEDEDLRLADVAGRFAEIVSSKSESASRFRLAGPWV